MGRQGCADRPFLLRGSQLILPDRGCGTSSRRTSDSLVRGRGAGGAILELHILILCDPCLIRISREEKMLACLTGRSRHCAGRVLDSNICNAVQCRHFQNQTISPQADLRNQPPFGYSSVRLNFQVGRGVSAPYLENTQRRRGMPQPRCSHACKSYPYPCDDTDDPCG